MRKDTAYVVSPVKEYGSEDVKEVRIAAHLTQKTLAEFLGVSIKAVEAWERGRNVPSGPACRLLSFIESDPSILERELQTKKD